MKPNTTEIIVVLDRSGSMWSVKEDSEGGYNSFIEEQKAAPGECKVTLYQFDNVFETVYSQLNVQEVPKLDLRPRNGTALLDAIGRAILETGKRFETMQEKDRPEKVVFVVLTDGHENMSNEFNYTQIASMIEHQQTKYSWLCTFLGAGMDVVKQAGDLGFHSGKTLGIAPNGAGQKGGYDSLSKTVADYRGLSASDAAQVANFNVEVYSKEDRDEQVKLGL